MTLTGPSRAPGVIGYDRLPRAPVAAGQLV